MPSNRETVERYAEAICNRDWKAVLALLDDDFVGEFPQSAELIRGRDNWAAIYSYYEPELPESVLAEVAGDEAQQVYVSAAAGIGMPMITVTGGGDSYTVAGKATYPNGDVYHVVSILHLRDGKIIKETSYFAAPFDSPEWRRDLVERTDD